MELDKIKDLMNQFEDSDMRELKLDDGDFHLYLSKNKNAKIQASPKVVKVDSQEKQESKQEVAPKKQEVSGKAVKAPIVGIVYLQAKPGQPPFVKVGDHVNVGDTVCIIEAMKMMTEVKSKISGTVTAINVENEDLVEVDQPVITLKED